jgi:phage anti-repressor protein
MSKAVDSVMWQVIEDMNFNKRGHDEAGLYLINESGLTLDAMKKVEMFARRKQEKLYRQLFDVTGVSDDSYDDLLWQIVANGEEFYNNITLEKAQSMIDNNEYTESFAYAFHKVDDLVEEDQSLKKHEQQLAYIERCRQGVHGSFHKALVDAFDKADNVNKMRLSLGFQEVFGEIV